MATVPDIPDTDLLQVLDDLLLEVRYGPGPLGRDGTWRSEEAGQR